MAEVLPAIIPESFEDLTEKMGKVSGLVSTVQIDVMDGSFTKPKSWPYIYLPDQDFVKIIKEEEPFPFSEDLMFEVHFMVKSPENFIQEWVSAGAQRILVHFESFSDKEEVISFCKRFKEQFGTGDFLTPELGVVINMETPVEVLDDVVGEIDYVQFMSIATIGYQGKHIPFEEKVLDKIRAFHEKYPNIPISVDGGVNLENANDLINTGVSRLVIGGAIFGSGDIPGTIEEFKSL